MSQVIFDREFENYVNENFTEYPRDVHENYKEEYEITDVGEYEYDNYREVWKTGWYEVSVELQNELNDYSSKFFESIEDYSGDYKLRDSFGGPEILDSRTISVIGIDWSFTLKFEYDDPEDFVPFIKYLPEGASLGNPDYQIKDSTTIQHLSYGDIDELVETLDTISKFTEEDLGDDSEWDEFCEYYAEENVGKTKEEILSEYKDYLEL